MNYKVEAWSWCADYCKKNQWNPHDSYFWNKALLEYRRQHNIFEVGDEVVYVDDFMPDSVSVVSEVNDRVWLNSNNAVCIKEMIKHTTDAEIKAGKRLEVS